MIALYGPASKNNVMLTAFLSIIGFFLLLVVISTCSFLFAVDKELSNKDVSTFDRILMAPSYLFMWFVDLWEK